MASDKDRFIALVAKLLELTQDGKIKWDATRPRASLTNDPDLAVDVVYTTHHQRKRLGLYQIKRRYEAPPKGSLSAIISGYSGYYRNILGTPPPKWQLDHILELIDDSGNCLWTFPSVSGLGDLFSAVQFQAAGVSEFLDDVLGKGSK